MDGKSDELGSSRHAHCVNGQLSQLLRKEVHVVVHVATEQHVAESAGSSEDVITCDGGLKTMHPH